MPALCQWRGHKDELQPTLVPRSQSGSGEADTGSREWGGDRLSRRLEELSPEEVVAMAHTRPGAQRLGAGPWAESEAGVETCQREMKGETKAFSTENRETPSAEVQADREGGELEKDSVNQE